MEHIEADNINLLMFPPECCIYFLAAFRYVVK